MTVHNLEVSGLAACLYRGLRRLAHGPGPAYLYKPILHLVLPREIRKLVMLDTDAVNKIK